MRQPKGFEDDTGRVCLLKRSIYGLCQSARVFYRRIMEMLGWKRFHAEYAI